MFGVVFRYLFAEAARTWLAVIGVLLFLTLGLALSRFIGDAAAGEVPVNMVLALAGLTAVKNLDIVLPVSFFLAILLVVGRLCRDNEMAALAAGGAGLIRVSRPFFVLAAGIGVFAFALALFAAPRAELAADRLAADTALRAIESLAPGRFYTFMDGDIVFYARGQDADGSLRNVFLRVVRDKAKAGPVQTVVVAKRARQRVDAATRRVTLVLDHGWRYTGVPGRADYRVIKFGEHGVQIRPPLGQPKNRVDTQPTTALLASRDPNAIAEWQKRLSVPISIIVLCALAPVLARAPPRAGRYARVVVGILFYVVYVNAIHLAAVGVENGAVPVFVGVWWVHALVLAVALALILREQGFFARWRRRRPR